MRRVVIRKSSRLCVLAACCVLPACFGCQSVPAAPTWSISGVLGDAATSGSQDEADSGHPNGCGPSGALGFLVPECPLGVVCFSAACNTHDLCYEFCESSKQECDREFYDDMQSACSAVRGPADPVPNACLSLAYIYWQAVVRFGQPFFAASRETACADSARGRVLPKPSNPDIAAAPFEDVDDDLLPDDWERAKGCDPQDPTDAMQDFDFDGRPNLQEFLFDTDPLDPNDPL